MVTSNLYSSFATTLPGAAHPVIQQAMRTVLSVLPDLITEVHLDLFIDQWIICSSLNLSGVLSLSVTMP
jgi:hypothetical protein